MSTPSEPSVSNLLIRRADRFRRWAQPFPSLRCKWELGFDLIGIIIEDKMI